ncbi:MAG: ribonuclease H-like YkuK family protein [Thermaerobacter sp.]|nr:ribonuclease H-like YkuK family protein [Thermaerobacter sp.]
MIFESPTKGRLTFDEMFADMLQYLNQAPDDQYRIIIGTDSHTRHDTILVTAVVVHHLGKGGRYYFHRSHRRTIKSLRQKIFYETSTSLSVASRLTETLEKSGVVDLDIQIHIDVGRQGETKELIREIVGMVTGSGYRAAIKPESFGASTVADKYTK